MTIWFGPQLSPDLLKLTNNSSFGSYFANFWSFWAHSGRFLAPLTQARAMLSWGPDQIVIVYVPRACTKNILMYFTDNSSFGTYFSSFRSFWAHSGRFWTPLTQARAMLSWGPGQIVIVYVPSACNKKNLESISPKILVLGHILLVFGYFGVFVFSWDFLGCSGGP